MGVSPVDCSRGTHAPYGLACAQIEYLAAALPSAAAALGLLVQKLTTSRQSSQKKPWPGPPLVVMMSHPLPARLRQDC